MVGPTLRREYNYITRDRRFYVTASDFTNVDLSTVHLRYEVPYEKFVDVAMGLSVPVIGSLLYRLMKRLHLQINTKKIIFALVCTWLVAPVPVPTTTATILAPKVFLFPWTDFRIHFDFVYYKAH